MDQALYCLCNRTAHINTVPAFQQEVLHQRYTERSNALCMAEGHREAMWQISCLMEDDVATMFNTYSNPSFGCTLPEYVCFRKWFPHHFMISLRSHLLILRLQPEMERQRCQYARGWKTRSNYVRLYRATHILWWKMKSIKKCFDSLRYVITFFFKLVLILWIYNVCCLEKWIFFGKLCFGCWLYI